MREQEESKRVKRTQRDYSMAFKIAVVDEIEKGELTYMEAHKRYGIQGHSTVLKWLRKHGRLDWREQSSMKERQSPHKKIKELEKKVKMLELEKEVLNRAIDIADDMLGTNIRKKYLSLLSEASGQQGIEKEPPQAESE